MALAEAAAGFSVVATALHLISVAIAARRVRPPGAPLAPAPDAPAVSIVQPLRGVEAFGADTLAAILSLDYPRYEVTFCVADADDPVCGLVRRAIAAHPRTPARLLTGDDPISGNPKLNNIVKGWTAARHDWIVMVDSNVLAPPDYLQRLFAAWGPGVGLVCQAPVGARPDGFFAELECAFLNSYQARWQMTADSLGFGFAQGKSMLWRRDILEAAGGVARLGADIAEDAAATKVVIGAGLRVRLVDAPFPQPLGARRFRDVWARQLRWARLRRRTFPHFFAPEILSGALLPGLAAGVAAHGFALSAPLALAAFALVWFGAEAGLTRRARWPLGWRGLAAMALRDALLPALWIGGWSGDTFVWRGNAMTVRDERRA